MSWYKATYRCLLGHEHRVTLPSPPDRLFQPHGRAIGKPPVCDLPLARIQKVFVG